jgi:protein-tyrosine phosphatase
MIKVLFICMGNICRSPMAEAIFQHKVDEAGLSDKIMVDSAGTHSYHVGEKAHEGTLAILKKHGIPYDGRARQFARRDLTDFDYILAMDKANLAKIQAYAGGDSEGELKLFLRYSDSKTWEVPDPYYDGRFAEVYELVNKGCDALLAHIRATHKL